MIAYRGTAPATVDVLAGHIPLAVLDIPASQQLIQEGKLKALGVSAAKRVGFLPDVPPLAEQGLSGFESVGWFGIVAPAGTPPDVISKLNAAFVKALSDPAAIEKIRVAWRRTRALRRPTLSLNSFRAKARNGGS